MNDGDDDETPWDKKSKGEDPLELAKQAFAMIPKAETPGQRYMHNILNVAVAVLTAKEKVSPKEAVDYAVELWERALDAASKKFQNERRE